MQLTKRKQRSFRPSSRQERYINPQSQKNTIHKQLRYQNGQALNQIKNNIHRTFSHQNKRMNYLKQQLNSKINPKYNKRIDRMCVQYSICQKPKLIQTTAQDVDLEYIAKTFIKKKSKDKKKQQNTEALRQSVQKVANRFIKQSPYLFFNFEIDKLREIQRKNKKDINNTGEHPYLSIYQSSQQQVINYLSKNKRLSLGEMDEMPQLDQPNEWQRERKHIQGIYAGVKNLRVQTARQRPSSKSYSKNDSFYIT